MSNFQEINEQGNYNEKISEIASRLAINKYNSLKGRNVNLDFEISENEKVVRRKISDIRIEIEKKVPGLELPKDLNDTIAEYLLGKMNTGVNDIYQLTNQNSISDTIFKKEILPAKDADEVRKCIANNVRNGIHNQIDETEIYKIQENLQKANRFIDINPEYKAIDVSQQMKEDFKYLGEVQDVISLGDGGAYVVIKPENEKYDFIDEADKENEIQIGLKQREISELMQDYISGKPKEETLGNLEKKLNGNGIDAALRYLNIQITAYGAERLLHEKNVGIGIDAVKMILNSTSKSNAKENGYEEDQYTMVDVISIYSKVLNSPAIDKNSKDYQDLIDTMKKANPRLFAILEKDPQIIEKMQTVSKKIDLYEMLIELTGSSKKMSKEDAFCFFEDAVKKYAEVEIDHKYTNIPDELNPLEDRQEIVFPKSDRKPPNKKSTMEVYEEKKKAFEGLAQRLGVGIAIKSFLSPAVLEYDKEMMIEILSEVLDFENLDKPGNLVEKIKTKDIDFMKDTLQTLINGQNQKNTSYICALGNVINMATDRQKDLILSAENIKTEEIIEHFSDGKDSLVKGGKNSPQSMDERNDGDELEL